MYGKKKGATFNGFCRNTVLRFPCGRNKIHPTQKPLALIDELVKTSSKEGDTVFDPCMGSGTTCVSAKNNNRNYIGIELDEEYFKLAKARVEAQ